MPQPRPPDATFRHAPRSLGRESTFWQTLGLSAPLSLVALWLALSPAAVRAADEPVDVPITRGKIDLSGLKPALALPSPAGAPAPATPGAPSAPVSPTQTGAPPAAAVPPGTTPTPTRPKPRTVADYVAEAKAKAAAEAAAKAAGTAGTPPPPGPATAAVAAATPPAPATAAVTAPVTPVAAPDPKTTEKAAEKAPPKALPKPPPPVPAKAAPKPRDEGLDKVAVKLVEAMARAAAKQDKREATQPKPKTPLGSKEDIKARAAAVAGHAPNGHDSAAGHGDSHGGAHWAYEGPGGPDNWAKLKPDFNTCAVGQRQSPIAIDNSATLQGPAEPIGFSYQASEGSVVNNGHTIQVDLAPGNAIAVRDSTYQLLQFHFHHPAEETVNGQGFAMVAHLVHKNAEGQLAVVAVLLTPGETNPAVDTVWRYMPVDTGDRVKLPTGALNLPDLLPKDQRYYQFMGSLTTPPCTEGVLWMVLKTPVTLSPAQIRLFGQLFPHNARPVQPVNGRPVREAL